MLSDINHPENWISVISKSSSLQQSKNTCIDHLICPSCSFVNTTYHHNSIYFCMTCNKYYNSKIYEPVTILENDLCCTIS